MTTHDTLPTLGPDEITLVTGGTRFYSDKNAADKMAVQLEKWNPGYIYDTRESNGRYYVSNGRPRPRDKRDTY